MSRCMHCCDERPQGGSRVLACLSQFDTNQITGPVTVQDGLIVAVRIKVHLRGVVGRVLIPETLTVAPRQPASFAVSIAPQLQFACAWPHLCCSLCDSVFYRSSSELFALTLLVFLTVFVFIYLLTSVQYLFCLFCWVFLAVWNKPEFYRNTFAVVRVAVIKKKLLHGTMKEELF